MTALVALAAIVAIACSGPAPSTPAAQLPTQAMAPEEIATSDRFWAAEAFFGPTNFMYDSLAEMTTDAHLVILGRVVGIRVVGPLPARDPGGEQARPQRVGVVAIDEVLKGRPIMGDAGKVLVARLVSTDQTETDLPRERFVIFLKNYGELKADGGRGCSTTTRTGSTTSVRTATRPSFATSTAPSGSSRVPKDGSSNPTPSPRPSPASGSTPCSR